MKQHIEPSRGLEEAFDHCLDLLAQGESVESCLARYPHFAQELGTLLGLSLLIQGMASFRITSTARERIKTRLLHELHKKANKTGLQEASKEGWFTSNAWRWTWATATGVMAMVLIGAGTVRASVDSLPGEPMYEVKVATEQVQIAFTRPEIDRARLQADLADRRAYEMVTLARRGKAKEVTSLANRLTNHVARAVEFTSLAEADPGSFEATSPDGFPPRPPRDSDKIPGPSLGGGQQEQTKKALRGQAIGLVRQTLKQRFLVHQRMLEAAVEDAPPASRAALRQTLLEYSRNYRKALGNLEPASQKDDSP